MKKQNNILNQGRINVVWPSFSFFLNKMENGKSPKSLQNCYVVVTLIVFSSAKAVRADLLSAFHTPSHAAGLFLWRRDDRLHVTSVHTH